MMNPYERYRTIATETADPVELVVMLYRGAIGYLSGAEDALQSGQIERSHRLLIRTQDIVAELMATLNLDAGELAHNLHRLYDYMQRRLLQANLRKDAAAVAEVRGLLGELLVTWEEIGRRQRTTAAAGRVSFAAVVA